MVANGNHPATVRRSGGLAGRSRATAARLLLLGWYLLAGLLIAGCGWLLETGLATALQPSVPGSRRYGAIALGLMGTWLAGSAVYAVIRSARRSTAPAGGAIPLSRKQAPALWRTVEILAGELGTEPPSEISLTVAAGVSVTERSRWLGLAGGPQVLCLGAPLLFGLSTPELQALLSHELARPPGRPGSPALVRRGHTALHAASQWPGQPGRWLGQPGQWPGQPRASGRARLIFWSGFPAWLLLRGSAALYTRAFRRSLRRQERAADLAAARIAGTQAVIGALAAAQTARLGWQDFTSTALRPARAAGPLPDDPFRAYQEIFAAPGYRAGLPDRLAAQLLLPTRDGPRASLARCIEALQQAPRQTGTLDRAPGSKLRDPVRRLLPQLTGQLYATLGDPGPDGIVPWQRWLQDTARRLADQQSAPLKEAAGELAERARVTGVHIQDRPGAAGTLATVLDLLDAAYGPKLESRAAAAPGYPGGLYPSQPAARLAAAIVTLAGQVRTEAGTTSWAIGWAGSVHLHGAPASQDRLTALALAAIHHPAGVPALRARLADLGVGAAPIVSGEPDTEPAVNGPVAPTGASPGAATAPVRQVPAPRKQRARR